MREGAKHGGFEVAEVFLAVQAEDRRDIEAGALYDQGVGVDELETELPRDQPPERGFPAAHEADENEIGVLGRQEPQRRGTKRRRR
jgi:hypothetical protein